MRKFAMVKREPALKGVHPADYTIQVKDANEYRRWPHRPDFRRYATKKEAEYAAVDLYGYILIKRWCDAELTIDEQKASGY